LSSEVVTQVLIVSEHLCRQAAYHVDAFLMGESSLPLKGEGDLPRV